MSAGTASGDRALLRLIEASELAARELDESDCTFWACDGPGKRPVHMKTCTVHWTAWELRKAARQARRAFDRRQAS